MQKRIPHESVETAGDWDLYRSLLAVLDEGSLSGAARLLGMAQPTIGRHIAAREIDGPSAFHPLANGAAAN